MEDEDVQQKMQEIQDGEGDAAEYSFDDHEGWGDMSDAEKELVKGKIREILRDAVKEADAKNGWGSVPSESREQLRSMVSNEVDWKAILRQTIGMAHSSERTTSRKRRNRKYRFMHPGVKRKRMARVLVATRRMARARHASAHCTPVAPRAHRHRPSRARVHDPRNA